MIRDIEVSDGALEGWVFIQVAPTPRQRQAPTLHLTGEEARVLRDALIERYGVDG